MTKTNSHPNMNDNNDNDIIEFIDAASELVAEVPYDIARDILDEEIDILIVFDNNQHNVLFGQAEYWPVPFATLLSYYVFGILHRQRAVNIRPRYIAAAIVLLVVLSGCVYLISQFNIEDTPEHDAHMYVTLDDDQQDASKNEQNGAVSTENARPTNLYIPKETSPIDSNEEIENNDA